MVNISFNLLLRDGPHRAAKIATCPQVLPPVTFLERGELILQFVRRRAFQVLHDLRWTERWRTGHHHMYMVGAEMAFHNRDFTAHTDLSDDVACAFGDLAPQHLVTVFGDPHQMILNVVHGMRSLAIVGHVRWLTILQGILPLFRAEAIRLKAEVLDQAHGN